MCQVIPCCHSLHKASHQPEGLQLAEDNKWSSRSGVQAPGPTLPFPLRPPPTVCKPIFSRLSLLLLFIWMCSWVLLKSSFCALYLSIPIFFMLLFFSILYTSFFILLILYPFQSLSPWNWMPQILTLSVISGRDTWTAHTIYHPHSHLRRLNRGQVGPQIRGPTTSRELDSV